MQIDLGTAKIVRVRVSCTTLDRLLVLSGFTRSLGICFSHRTSLRLLSSLPPSSLIPALHQFPAQLKVPAEVSQARKVSRLL